MLHSADMDDERTTTTLGLAALRVVAKLVTPERETHCDERHRHNGADNEDQKRRDGHLPDRLDNVRDAVDHDGVQLDQMRF